MDFNVLAQLIGAMSDAASKLETAIARKDKTGTEKAKTLVLKLQEQIAEELK